MRLHVARTEYRRHDFVRVCLNDGREQVVRLLMPRASCLGVAEDAFGGRVPVGDAKVGVEQDVGEGHPLDVELEPGQAGRPAPPSVRRFSVMSSMTPTRAHDSALFHDRIAPDPNPAHRAIGPQDAALHVDIARLEHGGVFTAASSPGPRDECLPCRSEGCR